MCTQKMNPRWILRDTALMGCFFNYYSDSLWIYIDINTLDWLLLSFKHTLHQSSVDIHPCESIDYNCEVICRRFIFRHVRQLHPPQRRGGSPPLCQPLANNASTRIRARLLLWATNNHLVRPSYETITHFNSYVHAFISFEIDAREL